MRDPVAAPLSIVQLTTPLARHLSLRTLPLHTHEILPAFAFYNFLNLYISPTISRRCFPQTYPALPERSRTNWNAHVVSLVQSTVVNAAALWVIWKDKERWAMGPGERVWGYTGSMGMVQGLSAGYFLWDLMAAALRIDVHGPGALVHAAAALAVSMLGFVSFICAWDHNALASLIKVASLLQLLRHQLCTLRIVNAVLEHPLVHG